MHNLEKIKKWLGSGSINIFGRPFAGKDYQGRILADIFDGHLLGGGDILRNSNIPERSQECLRRGELIPSEDYVSIVLPYLRQQRFAGKPLILSSVGRWHGEEPGVIQAVEESGHPLKAVFYLSLTDEDVHKRWKELATINDRSDRHDDTEEILRTRFAEFNEKTIPVIDYYRENNLLIEIDGTKSKQEVTDEILINLERLSSS